MSVRKEKINTLVLIGVVNRWKDLDLILKKQWYRIPVKYMPKRQPAYIAFYQTHVFGPEGKSIRCYAQVKSFSIACRAALLPDEDKHPQAREYYYRFNLDKVKTTPRIIRNNGRRRISFGFTSLDKLLKSRQICQLFDIIPVEDIMRQALEAEGITARPEYCVMENKHCRYRLDFAVFCRGGKIALECDNEKWHGVPAHRNKDKERDRYLVKQGWVVLRLPGSQIEKNLDLCLKQTKETIEKMGGLINPDL